jgi:oligopeptide transport system ATP-binding protein
MKAMQPMPKPVISVRGLSVHYPASGRSGVVRAVENVNLDLRPGETLGIVGESGCGKSTLARTLVGLQSATAGQIRLGDNDVTRLSPSDWRPLRRRIQMIFQDPLASLDPRMTVGDAVAEPLRALMPDLSRAEQSQRVVSMLERVGLSRQHINRYPHEFSGGQCQRVGIARALVVEPEVLVCDEPVSALDVSVQAQIINLLKELQQERGLALVFIAHDLAVVRHISHRVMVMYLGRIMEQAASADLFAHPHHPYTRALLSAVPMADPDAVRIDRIILSGDLPSPANPPSGCVFRTRCPMVDDICSRERPEPRRQPHGGYSSCHFAANESSPMVARALR